MSLFQLQLHDTRIFDMMTLAQDVGLDELKVACENHVISTLSVTNACTFLMAVMDIQEKTSGKFNYYFSFNRFEHGLDVDCFWNL